jgi:hypothetical protein
MVNILSDCPAGWWDLNPTENLPAMLKTRAEEFGPETNEELIDMMTTTWECVKMSLVSKFVDSMPKRLEGVMRNEGSLIS